MGSRRLLATVVTIVATATVTTGAVSYAQGGGVGQMSSAAPAPANSVLVGIHQALGKLVAEGTITQAQANAVEQQAATGSIDPKALVRAGTLADVQMRTVADAIAQVKAAG